MTTLFISHDSVLESVTISGFNTVELEQSSSLIAKKCDFSDVIEMKMDKNSKIGFYNSVKPASISFPSNDNIFNIGSELIKTEELNEYKVENYYGSMTYTPDLIWRNNSPLNSNFTIEMSTLVDDVYLRDFQEFNALRTNFINGESLQVIEIITTSSSIDLYFASRNCILNRNDLWMKIQYYNTSSELVLLDSSFDINDVVFDDNDVSIWSDQTLNTYKISMPLVNPTDCICQVEIGCFHNYGTGVGLDEVYVYIDPQIYVNTI